MYNKREFLDAADSIESAMRHPATQEDSILVPIEPHQDYAYIAALAIAHDLSYGVAPGLRYKPAEKADLIKRITNIIRVSNNVSRSVGTIVRGDEYDEMHPACLHVFALLPQMVTPLSDEEFNQRFGYSKKLSERAELNSFAIDPGLIQFTRQETAQFFFEK